MKTADHPVGPDASTVHAGAPHATCNTHAAQVNADLPAFIQG